MTYTLAQLVVTLFNFYSTLIVVYCVLTWIPMRAGGIVEDIAMGGIDFSPVIAILALSAVERIVLAILV